MTGSPTHPNHRRLADELRDREKALGITESRRYATPAQPTSGGTPQFHNSAALRRAESIAPRAGRTAIAFGDACDRRVFASTKSSTVSRSRDYGWAIVDLDPSPDTGQALILFPGATAAVVLRRPVPRSGQIRRTRRFAER